MVTFKWDDKKAVEIAKEDGIAIGEARGEARGEEKARMSSIRAIMETAGVTAEKAMEMLKIDKSLWKKYLALL